MTADQRVTAAREYLDGARRRKAAELPPSLLVRECAELRRALGQVLDAIEEQAPVLLDALAVAAEYRRYRASLTCEACEAHPAELCDDHQADLDDADQYDDLASQIGGDQ